MRLSRTVSDINGDFSRKNRQFTPLPVYLTPQLTAFPLELGINARGQKLE